MSKIACVFSFALFTVLHCLPFLVHPVVGRSVDVTINFAFMKPSIQVKT